MAKTMESGHKMVWVKGEGYQYEHRLKAGAKKGQVVHHKDGNPGNNSKDNLQVTTKAGHNKIDKTHHNGGRKRGK